MNLIDKIDEYLLKKENIRDRIKHYPSDANACMRQLFYKWTTEPATNPVSASGLWKMKMGDSIHDLIHEFLSEAGFTIIPEVGGEKYLPGLNYPIGYRMDNLFVNPENGTIEGIEVKTGYGRGIRWIAKAAEPRMGDLMQCTLYLLLAGLEKIYLLYVARDDSYRTQFVIEMTPGGWVQVNGFPVKDDMVKVIIKRLETIEKHIESKAMPDREYKVAIKNGEIRSLFQKNNVKYKTDWQCSYCRWQTLCWRSEVEKYKTGDNSETFGGIDEDTLDTIEPVLVE